MAKGYQFPHNKWKRKYGSAKPTPQMLEGKKQYFVFVEGKFMGTVWAINSTDAQELAVQAHGPNARV